MDGPLSAPDLANAVTAFSTIGAGVTTFAFGWLVAPRHPPRWLLVYFALFFTGLPTLGWHGWGTEFFRIADVSTNLLLAFTIQLAVLGDYWPRSVRLRLGMASGALNLAAIAWMAREMATGVRSYAIDLGEHGGFYAGEAMLILDSLFVTALLWSKRHSFPPEAIPLLQITTGCFVVGLGLATATGTTVIGRVGSLHALWHVLGGFGFLFFWAFNHVRFSTGRATAATSAGS